MGDYQDQALICLQGHVVNDSTGMYQDQNAAFCRKCGNRTISACPACGHGVRGRFHSDFITTSMPYPLYCEGCGKPFPWTEARLKLADEMIQELSLSSDEKAKLKTDLETLVVE